MPPKSQLCGTIISTIAGISETSYIRTATRRGRAKVPVSTRKRVPGDFSETPARDLTPVLHRLVEPTTLFGHLHQLRKLAQPSCRCVLAFILGPSFPGVVGNRRFSFDIWGDAVNTASFTEAHPCPVGSTRMNISETVAGHVKALFELEPRGTIKAKHERPYRISSHRLRQDRATRCAACQMKIYSPNIIAKAEPG